MNKSNIDCPNPDDTVSSIHLKSLSLIDEFTFCGKYNFIFLRDTVLMYIKTSETYIRLMDFEKNYGMLQHDGAGNFFFFPNQTLNPDSWQHICLSVSKDSLKLVLNGDIIYNAPPNSIMTAFYEAKLFLGGENDAKKMERRFEGRITDVYLWNVALDIEDILLITTARESSKSIAIQAIFSWSTFTPSDTSSSSCVEFHNLDENNELFKENFKKNDILLIEHKTTLDPARNFCNAFGGKLFVPQNKTEQDLVSHLINKSDKCPVARIGLVKLDEKIVDLDGNEALYTSWDKNEPNGRELEQCVNIRSNSKYNDLSCSRKECYACKMPTRSIYSLRGNIPNGIPQGQFKSIWGIDRQYFVSMTGKKADIRGFKQTLCIWNNTWQFGPDLKQETLWTSYSIPPVGLHNWNNGQKLKFTQCQKDEFTCHKFGDCIPIENRCDGHKDCSEDGSDETDCAIMSLVEGYENKYSAKKNTTVSISMEILDILDIKELEMEYTARLKIELIWHDERITFRNLKQNIYDNQLNTRDIERIWSPKLLILDSDEVGIIKAAAGNQISEDLSLTKFSGSGSVGIRRNGPHKNNNLNEIDEDYLYSGSENAIIMRNYVVIRIGCKFYLQMYPFDSQICSIKLIKPTIQESYYILKWAKQPKIGNIDLSQYDVFPIIEYSNTNSTNQLLEVKIRLRRKLASHIFNTYVPTLCLTSIGGFTLFIDQSHFEATIMVALTTMLVIYTLHHSISSTLPPTAYMKMIDIWLFGGLIVPFVIIGILIFSDHLVMKEANQVIDLKNKEKNKWNSKLFITSMQIMLPLLAGILMGSYWIIGLIHYFS